jgi:hypothetical protein
MHPDFVSQIAQQRTNEIRQSAALDARGTAVVRPPRPSIRNRAGWTLVHLGLRLASR